MNDNEQVFEIKKYYTQDEVRELLKTIKGRLDSDIHYYMDGGIEREAVPTETVSSSFPELLKLESVEAEEKRIWVEKEMVRLNPSKPLVRHVSHINHIIERKGSSIVSTRAGLTIRKTVVSGVCPEEGSTKLVKLIELNFFAGETDSPELHFARFDVTESANILSTGGFRASTTNIQPILVDQMKKALKEAGFEFKTVKKHLLRLK